MVSPTRLAHVREYRTRCSEAINSTLSNCMAEVLLVFGSDRALHEMMEDFYKDL